MADGGFSVIEPNRRPAPAIQWKIASRCREHLPELYQPIKVRRLAQFFGALRDYLGGKSTTGRSVGVLSAGSYNESAFEHAYLARYLGILLLKVKIWSCATTSCSPARPRGLQPIEVLLRRLDADLPIR